MKSLLKVVRIVPVVVLTLIVVGCPELTSISRVGIGSENFKAATIKGKVQSTTGVPLEGTIVTGVQVVKNDEILEIDEETDGEGKYQFSDVLPGETHSVTVSKDGYEQKSKNVTPEPGETSRIDFELEDSEKPKITPILKTEADFQTEVKIIATITDNEKVSEAKLFYRISGDSSFIELDMAKTTGDSYEGIIPPDDIVMAGVEYYIYAEDATGNSDTSGRRNEPHNITVIDKNPPSIDHNTITEGIPDTSIPIIAEVKDDVKVEKVALFYKVKDDANFIEVEMVRDEGDTYKGELPKDVMTGGEVHYYLYADDGPNKAYKPTSALDTPFIITVDATPPDLTISQPTDGKKTNNPDLVVVGNVELESSVEVNGLSATPDVTTGDFSHNLTLASGSNTITVIAEDKAGNTNTINRTVILDTTPPSLNVLTPNDKSITSTATLSISGSVESGATLTINGTPVDPDFSTGGFSFNITLTEGDNTITVKATDEAGNITMVVRTVTLNASSVSGSESPPSGSTISGNTNIVITFTESMDTGTLSLGGTMASESNGGVWSTTTNTDDTLTISPTTIWTGGNRTLTINVNDLAGGASILSLSYIVDATSPTGSPSPGSVSLINGSTQIVITFSESMDIGTLSLGGTMAFESNGGVWSTTTNADDTLTISPTTIWTGGNKTLTINVNDLVGNSLSTLSLNYTVDPNLPIGSESPGSGSVISNSQQIVITFNESMDIGTLSLGGTIVSESNGGIWSTTTNTNDTLTISPTTTWTAGSRTLIVDAGDLAGNSLSTLSLNYTVDPNLPIGSESPGSGSVISNSQQIVITFNESMNTGTLSLGGTIVSESNGGIWSTTTNTNDTLTISPTTTWTAGNKTLIVDADDLVGNSLTTLNLSYTVDIALPTGSESPASGSVISNSQQIVITFNESMNTGTLSLGGTIVSESNGGVWSTTTNTNDTLTISPTTTWTAGSRTLTIDADDLVGNSLVTLNLSYTVDIALPTGGESPGSGSVISNSQQIVITFNESMNTGTLTLGGTMVSESNGGIWSTTTNTNDTLTISPTTIWTAGNRTLIVDADDLVGNSLVTLNLTYTVDIALPTGSESPGSGSVISNSQQIVITFNESMNTGTLNLGGSMASEDDGRVWSTTTNINDTLTISPTTTWTAGNRTLTIDADDLVGNSLTTLNLSYTVDTTLPTASSSPTNGSTLIESTQLVITFSESMNTGTLNLGGSMASEDDGGVWSTTTNNNDTLTISPTTTWSEGSGKTLTVDADDLVGNPLTTLNLNFAVLNGVVYVKTTGNDTNPGTSDLPKLTIQAAVDLADLLYTTAEVHVAEGTYNVTYQSGTHVVMKEGVSIYGGYSSSDWNNRNVTANITVIQDTSSSGGAATGPNRAIGVESAVTVATVIDGFTINGGGGTYSSAIFNNDGSPIIQNNTINGGSGSSHSRGIYIDNPSSSPTIQNNTIDGGSGSSSYGIFNDFYAHSTIQNNMINGGSGSFSHGIIIFTDSGFSMPTIQNNTIDGGSGSFSYGISSSGSGSPPIQNNTIDGGSGSSRSYGIFVQNSATIQNNTINAGSGGTNSYGVNANGSSSSPIIRNNTIDGGGGSNSSNGIASETGSSPTIQNNTIYGGSGGNDRGIHISSSSPAIENNIIFSSGGSFSYCIYELNTSSDPTSVRNNDLFDCSTALYRDADGGGNLTTISAMETDLTNESITNGGNVNVDPAFVDKAGGDWHLTASSPTSVTEGGLNLSGSFTTDKDGITRTVSWSMGAYEKD